MTNRPQRNISAGLAKPRPKCSSGIHKSSRNSLRQKYYSALGDLGSDFLDVSLDALQKSHYLGERLRVVWVWHSGYPFMIGRIGRVGAFDRDAVLSCA